SDTYVYRLGDGNDEISDDGSAPNDVDTLQLTDLSPADVLLTVDGDGALTVHVVSSGEDILIGNEFTEALFPGSGSLTDGIDVIIFADGTTWDRAAIADAAGFVPPQPVITGTEGADELHGDFGQNLILGLGGDDTIFGAGGDDTIEGGTGNDVVHGDDGDDFITGGPGNDTLYGDAGDDLFVATPGDGNDSIDGGPGFDYDQADYSNITTPITVDLGQGTATGVDIGTDTLANIMAVYGGSGDDTLIGSTAYDELYGGDGNDTLIAVGGDDGGDYIEGNRGNDLYLVGLGVKDLTLADWGDAGDFDVLSFAAGIAPEEVSISREGTYHVLLSIGDGEDSVFLGYQLFGPQRAIEEIHFADGTVWTGAELREQIIGEQSTEDDDFILGTNFDDEIHGGGGDDVINAVGGSDILEGGAGDDRIVGVSRKVDTYVFTGAFGHDQLTRFEPTGLDQFEHRFPLAVIQFDNPVFSSFAEVLAASTEDGSGVMITIDANRSVHLDFVTLASLRTENFVFANPEVVGTYGADTLAGSAGDDTILGLSGNDIITTGGGSDAVDGGSGTDTLVPTGNRGDYAIAYDANTQRYTLADQRAGAPDGSAAVKNVEFYQFADQTVAAGNLLGGANAAPTDITLSGGTVDENSAAGTVVGTLASADPDADDTFAFSLVGGATDLFAVDGNHLVVASGAMLDFESAGSHDVSVRVTDAGGLTFEKTFSIAVADVNEAPANATLAGGTVAENAANGAAVGTVTGS